MRRWKLARVEGSASSRCGGGAEARDRLAAFRRRYNEVRPHWALVPTAGGDPVTPADVYRGQTEVQIPAWQGWAKAAKAKLDALLDHDAEKVA